MNKEQLQQILQGGAGRMAAGLQGAGNQVLGPGGPAQQRGPGRKLKLDIGGARRLGGLRGQLHQSYRQQGLAWRGIGVAIVTNATGSDQLVWASSGTTSPAAGGIKLPGPMKSARLVVQNDGGSCDRLSGVTTDGQVIYTGAAAFPSAHCLIGKGTGVIDPLDKDTGMPVGNVDNTFDVQVWLANGDTAVVGLNGYTRQAFVEVDNDDDAADDE